MRDHILFDSAGITHYLNIQAILFRLGQGFIKEWFWQKLNIFQQNFAIR